PATTPSPTLTANAPASGRKREPDALRAGSRDGSCGLSAADVGILCSIRSRPLLIQRTMVGCLGTLRLPTFDLTASNHIPRRNHGCRINHGEEKRDFNDLWPLFPCAVEKRSENCEAVEDELCDQSKLIEAALVPKKRRDDQQHDHRHDDETPQYLLRE